MPDRQRGVVYGRRPRKDGRWQGYIALSGKRRRTVIRPTEAEMRRDVDALAAQLLDGHEPSTDDPTLAIYVTRWIVGRRDGTIGARPLAFETVRRYEQLLRNQIVPHIGNVRMSRLRASHIEDVLLPNLRKDGASGTVLLQVYRLLHVVLKRADRQGVVRRNWCDLVDPPIRGVEAERELDTDAVTGVLQAARGHRHEALLWTAIGTGARKGELFALRSTDLDLDRAVVHVREKVQWQTGRGSVRSAPKTKAGIRTLALPSAVVAMLRAHLARQAKGGRANPLDLVFPSERGTHLQQSNWNRYVWAAWLDAAHLDPRTTFRALTRKASHSLLAAAGVDPETIRHRAGHTSATTTFDHYVQTVGAADRAAADKLDAEIRKLASARRRPRAVSTSVSTSAVSGESARPTRKRKRADGG